MRLNKLITQLTVLEKSMGNCHTGIHEIQHLTQAFGRRDDKGYLKFVNDDSITIDKLRDVVSVLTKMS